MAALVTLHVLDADQADVAGKLLAAAGDRHREVLSISGGFQAPADIVEAAGLATESFAVALPATTSSPEADAPVGAAPKSGRKSV